MINLKISQTLVPARRIPMSDEQPINQTDELIEEFIADCEREAARLEITVDYYLAEFV
jgi:hypothetical protein